MCTPNFIDSVPEDYLHVVQDDDPDQEKAGNGLDSFPLIYYALGQPKLLTWQMSPAEKVGLIFLLEQLKPDVAIEIGTRFGGSLQVLSRFCKHVYSIDIDPEVPHRLAGMFSNVEYLTGQSDQILPVLLQRIEQAGSKLTFALVDGDHSSEGVRKDIDALLGYRPIAPLYIVMHDSFNPQCRLGLRQANWRGNKYVHAIELDFISGTINRAPVFRGELWGGLALGILLPIERKGRFEISARAEESFLTAVNRKTSMSFPGRLAQFFGKSRQDQLASIKATLGSMLRQTFRGHRQGLD